MRMWYAHPGLIVFFFAFAVLSIEPELNGQRVGLEYQVQEDYSKGES
jgi:hypothetical protein